MKNIVTYLPIFIFTTMSSIVITSYAADTELPTDSRTQPHIPDANEQSPIMMKNATLEKKDDLWEKQYLTEDEIAKLERDKLLEKQYFNTENKKYFPQIQANLKFGYPRNIFRPMLLIPLTQTPINISYFHLISMVDSKLNFEMNAAFGYRKLIEDFIYGFYSYYDFRITNHHNHVHQFTFGIEYLRKYFEARLNLYIPLKTKFLMKTDHFPTANFNGTHTTIQSIGNVTYEAVRPGIDFEVGGNFRNNLQLSGFMKIFFFYHSQFKNIVGVQTRIQYKINKIINFDIEGVYDNHRKFAGYFGIGFNWSFGDKQNIKLTHLERKMTQMPLRDIDAITTIDIDRNKILQTITEEGEVAVISNHPKATGQAIYSTINQLNRNKNQSGSIVDLKIINDNGDIVGVKNMSNTNLNKYEFSTLNPKHIHPNGIISKCLQDQNESRTQIIALLNNKNTKQAIVNNLQQTLSNELAAETAAAKAKSDALKATTKAQLQQQIAALKTALSNI